MVRVLIVSTTKVNLLPYEEAYAYEEVDGRFIPSFFPEKYAIHLLKGVLLFYTVMMLISVPVLCSKFPSYIDFS